LPVSDLRATTLQNKLSVFLYVLKRRLSLTTLNENWSVTAGRFINSNNAYSNYAGAYYLPFYWGRWKAGVVGGTFNGYPNAFDGGWFPAILPVVTVEGECFGLNIALVPPLKDRLYGAVSFQLKLKVN
jgi:hypothetical protein